MSRRFAATKLTWPEKQHASMITRPAPPFRLGGARACFSHRIIKRPSALSRLLSLRQNRPTLVSVSGRWSLLDGMSAIVAGSFHGANPMNSPAPSRSPLRMQTMPGKSLATSLKRNLRALNDMHFRTWSRKVRETRSSSSQKRSEVAAMRGQAGDEHGGPPWFKGTRGRRGRGHPLCGTNVNFYEIHFHQYWTGVW